MSVIFLGGCKPTAELTILPATKVNEAHRSANYEFAKSQFEACTTGKYPALTEANATPGFAAALTVDVARQTCATINQSHGELTKLTLYEILKRGTSQLVYRYKASYSKAPQQAEIRLYTTLDNKYDGVLFRQVWSTKYYISTYDRR